MARKITFDENQLAELRDLIGQGMRQTDIAKHFKVTDDTIRRICRENDIKIRMPHKCTCIICGDTFYSNIKGAKTCKKEHHAKCVVCGKDFVVDRYNIKDTCSAKCSSLKKYGVEHHLQAKEVIEKRQQTLEEKYGVTNVSQLADHNEKSKKTCLERYGAESYAGSEIGRAKTKATNLSKYGYEEPFGDKQRRAELDQIIIDKYGTKWATQSDKVKEKTRHTNIEKYGVANPMQNDSLMQRQHESMVKHYGVESPLQVPEIREKVIAQFQERYGYSWPLSDPSNRSTKSHSKINEKFESKLSEANIDYKSEFRLDKYSFDDKCGTILIEIDPTFTHNSAIGCFGNDPVDPNYHFNKSNTAELHGYHCIHVFDWDNWDSIIEILRPKTTIFARKCEVHDITRKNAEEFENQNHIQGSCYGQHITLGLFYENKLIQIMTFGKPRYNRNYDVELLRLCSLRGYSVIGGASKLFKHFTRLHPDQSVISYCDAAKFSGKVYSQIGMEFSHQTQPAKVWSKDKNKITDNLLRQRGYDQLFKTNYGKGTSNEQLMLENGWLPVYDCGQKVFTYTSNR